MPAQPLSAAPYMPMRQQIGLDEIQNPAVQHAYELWNRQRGVRAYPARGDITPRQMPDLLRNVALVRVLEGGEEFQIRVMGDALVEAHGANFQGLTMHEIDLLLPEYGAAIGELYRFVCKTRSPRAFRGWYRRDADKHAFFHESVLLPLGAEGKPIDHILVVAVYARRGEELH